jgi:hypothetical protein
VAGVVGVIGTVVIWAVAGGRCVRLAERRAGLGAVGGVRRTRMVTEVHGKPYVGLDQMSQPMLRFTSRCTIN